MAEFPKPSVHLQPQHQYLNNPRDSLFLSLFATFTRVAYAVDYPLANAITMQNVERGVFTRVTVSNVVVHCARSLAAWVQPSTASAENGRGIGGHWGKCGLVCASPVEAFGFGKECVRERTSIAK
jgi:hypothetical protein